MEPSAASAQVLQNTDEYLLFDPRQARNKSAVATGGRNRMSYNEAIVFVVGGGSYLEFANLQELAERLSGTNSTGGATGGGASWGQERRITYGSTELMSPREFLDALGSLSRY